MTKYTCGMCGKEEELDTSVEEMTKELNDNFKGYSSGECDIVCDDCYNRADIARAIAHNNLNNLKRSF